MCNENIPLGDAIIQLSKNGFTNHKEVQNLYKDTEISISSPPKIIQLNRNIFSEHPNLKQRYITYQFDKALTQRTWCPEHIFTNRQLQAIYLYYKSFGFEMIDVGNRKYNLKEASNIIYHGFKHIGVCSGMGWLSIACGKKPDIWYATNSNCSHVKDAKNLWLRNEANIFYFDEQFIFETCNIAVDGKKYKHIEI